MHVLLFRRVNMEKLKSPLLVVFLLEEIFLSSAFGIIVNQHGRNLKPVSFRNALSRTLKEMENVPHKARYNERKAVNDKDDTVKNSRTSPKFFNAGLYGPPNVSDK